MLPYISQQNSKQQLDNLTTILFPKSRQERRKFRLKETTKLVYNNLFKYFRHRGKNTYRSVILFVHSTALFIYMHYVKSNKIQDTERCKLKLYLITRSICTVENIYLLGLSQRFIQFYSVLFIYLFIYYLYN